MATPKLTTTSYSILGLLAVKPWTTYELIQQVDRRLRRFWPRAQSKLYEEPKKLVALGLARATDEHVGRRPRTRYRITAKGRRALTAWLDEPGAGPVLEFEQLLKVHLTLDGSKAGVLTTLDATRAWVQEQNDETLTGRDARPERAVELLGERFLTDFHAMVADWADWATGVVEAWPDDVAEADLDRDEHAATIRRAERIRRRRPPP